MTQINWGILSGGGINPAAAFQQGYELSRGAARRQATEDVLGRYAAAPSMDALAPLAALDPQAFGILAKNERENADVRRLAGARQAYAGVLRDRYPVPNALAPTTEQPAGASPIDASGDVVVTGRTPPAPRQPTTSIADVAAFDPELAANLTKHMGDIDEVGRKAFAEKTGVAAAVALAAKGVPPEQRRAFIDSQYPLLKQAGWDEAQLDAFDPSDDHTLDAMAAIGVGADKYMADQRAAAGQAVTVRGQDVSAATTRRGQDISAATTRRGQDIGAATARAGQAVAMRGQDIGAATAAAGQAAKLAPKPAQVQLARGKLNSLAALEKQLNRAEAALNEAPSTGPVFGGFTVGGKNNRADVAVNQLAPLIRQLTRVPGEGAMSDYESRLAQAGLPSRTQTAEGRKEAIAGIRDLIAATRAGYSDLAGAAPASNRRSQFKVER